MRILDFADGFESAVEPTSVLFPASKVSNTPSGNLSATTVQGAVNELQGDIDTINNKVGVANGIASLDSNGKVPVSQIPALALVDVYQVADIAARDALTVEEGDVAVVANAGSGVTKTYVYGGSGWVELISDGSLAAHMANTSNPHSVTKSQVGLGNVDNTSDSTKNAASATLTNKSMSGSANTFTNIPLTSAVTGALPIANGGTGQTTKAPAFDALSPMTTGGDLIYGGSSGTGTRLPNGNSGEFLKSNGGTSPPSWGSPTVITAPPTVQKFTSGSGTYNKNYTFVISSGSATVGATYTNNSVTFTVYATVSGSSRVVMSGSGAPSSSGTLTKASGTGDSTITFSQVLAPLYLRVRMVGGGGGGAGGGATPVSGTAGGTTTFGYSLLSAGGGTNAIDPGSGSISSPAIGTALDGGRGGRADVNNSGAGNYPQGAAGGNSLFGYGGGTSGANIAGLAATAYGGGGGGGGTDGTVGRYAGHGGGGGGSVDAVIPNPSATYSYAVGAAGTGGTATTNGQNGAAGGGGYIEVTEHYQ